jgi:branched-chain amino acid transport system ATP-binding protein
MLQIKDLHAYYGAIEALKGIDMQVNDGEIACLIGSNGAGKTTLLKSISGVMRRTGSIKWNGEEIGSLTPKAIATRGILHVPEGRHIFPGLTVKENLEVGTAPYRGAFGKPQYKDDMERVFTLFPRLRERVKQLGWSLSGGEQQMLAIGRALMGRPKILLLDEPSMGLAPVVVDDLFNSIININKAGMPILLIEQNAQLALEISTTAYVIEQGSLRLSGPANELRHDNRVVEAYLGKFANADY